jgi:predicted amidophosphoribosyltransferase
LLHMERRKLVCCNCQQPLIKPHISALCPACRRPRKAVGLPAWCPDLLFGEPLKPSCARPYPCAHHHVPNKGLIKYTGIKEMRGHTFYKALLLHTLAKATANNCEDRRNISYLRMTPGNLLTTRAGAPSAASMRSKPHTCKHRKDA